MHYFGFTGPIDNGSVTRICGALNYAVNNQSDGIYLAFSSVGGTTADGVFLYNYIRALPVPVTIHAIGNVASIAVPIFVSAQTRICSEHVLFMIHPTSIVTDTNFMSGERLNYMLQAALAEEDRSDGILRQRCSIPQDYLTARRFREVHFSAQDAVKFGVAHRLEELSIPRGEQVIQI